MPGRVDPSGTTRLPVAIPPVFRLSHFFCLPSTRGQADLTSSSLLDSLILLESGKTFGLVFGRPSSTFSLPSPPCFPHPPPSLGTSHLLQAWPARNALNPEDVSVPSSQLRSRQQQRRLLLLRRPPTLKLQRPSHQSRSCSVSQAPHLTPKIHISADRFRICLVCRQSAHSSRPAGLRPRLPLPRTHPHPATVKHRGKRAPRSVRSRARKRRGGQERELQPLPPSTSYYVHQTSRELELTPPPYPPLTRPLFLLAALALPRPRHLLLRPLISLPLSRSARFLSARVPVPLRVGRPDPRGAAQRAR